MPNNTVSEQQIEEQIAAGKIQPIEASLITPNLPARPPFYSSHDPYQSSVLPPNFGLSPDLVKTDFGGYVPENRLMPVEGGPQANAKSQSVVRTIIEAGITNVSGSVVAFETNNIPNGNQTLLNLVQGQDIVLSSNNSGDVTISAPIFNASGPPHSSGTVPDPGSSAGITRFLCEDATFRVPPGSGGAANYQTVQSNGVAKPQESALNFLSPLTVTDNPGNTSSDVSILGTSAQTTSILNSGVISGVATSVMSISIAIPAKGGPYRIRVYYSLFAFSNNSSNGIDTWVSDGISNWAFYNNFSPVEQNGNTVCANATGIPPFTYPSGSGTVALTLWAQGNHFPSSWTIISSALAGPGVSTFAAEVVATT